MWAKRFLYSIAALILGLNAYAQEGSRTLNAQQQLGVQFDNQGRPIRPRTGGKDSLQKRDEQADSITIRYNFWDSTKLNKLDSSINDLSIRFPSSIFTQQDLGNMGTAARSLVFTPITTAGFDAGFHAFNLYRFTVPTTKFYSTTRPYTELGYLLGSRAEQFIHVQHTQNRNERFNFAFEYRLINGPGAFRNQNTAHNNIRFSSAYQSVNKRYSNNLIFISNTLRSSENGGLQNPADLDSLALGNPFEVETKLGTSLSARRSPFNTSINTGTVNNETIILLRQQYDFGQKDSLVTDSSTVQLFYPRFRFQHTIWYHQQQYSYRDFVPATADYLTYFNILVNADTVSFTDRWRQLNNELAIISYPQKNNLNQFLKIGAGLQLVNGTFTAATTQQTNTYGIAEYRNRTRNQKWNIEAAGKLFFTGIYAGNYEASAVLKTVVGKKLGTLAVGASNVNRSPSMVFGSGTSFPVFRLANLQNENITQVHATYANKNIDLVLRGNYQLLSNFTYFNGLYTPVQESTLFSVLQISAEKKLKLSRHWNYYLEGILQQATANAPVNVPTVLTRHRLAFEGNFFKNLLLSTGIEARIMTNFKPAAYNPLNQQFIVQNNTTTQIRPDVHAFVHFQIKTFKGFVRLENLNSFQINDNNTGFTRRNFFTPGYASSSMWLRIGIWWTFIN